MKAYAMVAVTALLAAASVMGAQDEDGGRGKGKGKGRQQPDPKAMFNRMDANEDGVIKLDEFKAAHEKRQEMMEKRREKMAERMKEKGQKGKARADREPPTAEEVFEKADADGNGEIDMKEWMQHQRKMRGKAAGQRKDRPRRPAQDDESEE